MQFWQRADVMKYSNIVTGIVTALILSACGGGGGGGGGGGLKFEFDFSGDDCSYYISWKDVNDA